MGNFLQIYQKEGTKGLWKASFLNYSLHFMYTLLSRISRSTMFSQNMEKAVANVCGWS